jgi:hypothetical protein
VDGRCGLRSGLRRLVEVVEVVMEEEVVEMYASR